MRVLAKNMAWLLNCIKAGDEKGIKRPQRDEKINTNNNDEIEFEELITNLLKIEYKDMNSILEFPGEDIIQYKDEAFNQIKYLFENEIKLCEKLNGKILVKKGYYDLITNGKRIIIVKNEGTLKRTAGIGDILGGFIMSEYLILAENITYKNNKLSCINIYD
mgnify:CR=1 FL=1